LERILKNKQVLKDLGATDEELAIASLETRVGADFNTSRYPKYDAKLDDAANFGIFKQNWIAIRHTAEFNERGNRALGQSTKYSEVQYTVADDLDSDLNRDFRVLRQSRQIFGDKWWSIHRGGAMRIAFVLEHSPIDLPKPESAPAGGTLKRPEILRLSNLITPDALIAGASDTSRYRADVISITRFISQHPEYRTNDRRVGLDVKSI
jgi:hypothetical protein